LRRSLCRAGAESGATTAWVAEDKVAGRCGWRRVWRRRGRRRRVGHTAMLGTGVGDVTAGGEGRRRPRGL